MTKRKVVESPDNTCPCDRLQPPGQESVPFLAHSSQATLVHPILKAHPHSGYRKEDQRLLRGQGKSEKGGSALTLWTLVHIPDF